MKTADLIFALKLAEPALATTDYILVLTHFCFNKKSLLAYDDISAIVVEMPNDLNCAVRGDPLLKIVSLLSGNVEMKEQDGKVIVTSGKSRAELPSLSPKEFLFKHDEVEFDLSFRCTEQFLSGLAACAAGVSADALQHKEWTAVTLRTGDNPAMYAYDSVSLLKVTLDGPLSKRGHTMLIPKSVAVQIGTIAAALEAKPQDILIRANKELLRVEFGNEKVPVHLVGKLATDEPTDYEHLIAGVKVGSSFKIPPAFFDAVSKTAIMQSSDLEPKCRILLDGNEMIVRGSGKFGKARTAIELGRSVDKIGCAVDPSRLLRYADKLSRMSVAEGGVVMLGEQMHYYISTYGDGEE